jgi:hypothetical protein
MAVMAAISLSWISTIQNNSTFLSGILDKCDGDGLPSKDKLTSDCQLRLIYVQVDRKSDLKPELTFHSIGIGEPNYFYPASLVKLPLTLMTLERIQEIRKQSAPWVDRSSRVEFIKAESCQTDFDMDTTSKERHPSMAHFIRRILTVSDNPSYNRLYDFLGQGEIKNRLKQKGFKHSRIPTRLNDCNKEQNKYAPYVRIIDDRSGHIHHIPARLNLDTAGLYGNNRKAGKAYIEGNRTHWKPKDFSNSNELPLEECLEMLVRFSIPEAFSPDKAWQISPDDRQFLWQYLGTFPAETGLKEFRDSTLYPRFLKKYFLKNASNEIRNRPSLKTFNIVGLSYGFVSDVTYVVDLDNGIEFFLAASIIANENGIIGDGKYNYESLAFPLFGRIFDQIYNYEKNRKRSVTHDFKEIREALTKPMM